MYLSSADMYYTCRQPLPIVIFLLLLPLHLFLQPPKKGPDTTHRHLQPHPFHYTHGQPKVLAVTLPLHTALSQLFRPKIIYSFQLVVQGTTGTFAPLDIIRFHALGAPSAPCFSQTLSVMKREFLSSASSFVVK